MYVQNKQRNKAISSMFILLYFVYFNDLWFRYEIELQH